MRLSACHALDQRLAAARDDHVDIVGHGQHDADGGAVNGGHKLDRRLRQACGLQAGLHAGGDGAGGFETVRSSAQDAGVAGLQAQPAGIGGDVGAALIDDADDAERYADAGDLQAVGALPLRHDGADGIGQGRHVFQALGDAFDAQFVQLQPVHQRRGGAARDGCGKVAGVGGQDFGHTGAECRRCGAQCLVLLRRRGQGKHCGCGARGAPQLLHLPLQGINGVLDGGHDGRSQWKF